MKRLPLLPTLIVALAVATMIALGVWQLERREEKAVALATLATNITRAPIAFPAAGTGDADLFRRSSIDCPSIDGVSRQSGRTANGRPGWRVIATCRTPAGPVPVQLGVAAQPQGAANWAGGRITGFISHAPDSRPIVAGLFDHSPKHLMLVAATPAPGLAANPGPDLSAVPNNHLAYAVQWFLFAAIAAVIYTLALRRRGRRGG